MKMVFEFFTLFHCNKRKEVIRLKNKSIIKISLLLIIILYQLSITAFANESDFQYEIIGSEAKITGIVGRIDDLIIPSTIGGYKVTTIGRTAFESNFFNSITIPDTVKIIEEQAFFGAYLRKGSTISIPASVTEIGSYAFSYMYGVDAFQVDSKNKNYTSLDGVLYNADKTVLLNYPLNKDDDIFIAPKDTTHFY